MLGNSLPNGGFEGTTPNWFSTGGTSTTAVEEWSTDEWRTGGHSLKITKSASDGTASWVSEDLYRYWSVFVGQNVGMEVGAWVKLDGVNTNPANDDEKIQLVFNFLDENGTDLLGAPLVLDVPQTAASTDWVEVKSATPISFPVTVAKITTEFRFGSSATGTAYADDWFIRNTTAGEWAGDFFNPNVDVPDGWFYWWPDFSAGKSGWGVGGPPVYAGQDVTEAHSGDASLKMVKDSTGYELVVNTDPTDFVNDGTPLVFSAYIKTILPDGMADSANADPSYAMGITVTWHDGTCGADGWGEVGGSDYRFEVAGDTTDWTLYQAVLTPPDGATQFSLRARYWHFFRGTTYWDDFKVMRTIPLVVDNGNSQNIIPEHFQLIKAYPNPFNPSVTIAFDLPRDGAVELSIYNLLGRKIATLIDQNMGIGRHRIRWDATSNTGEPVPTGIYFVNITFDGKESQIQKVTYLK